jgi:hypothetical protein
MFTHGEKMILLSALALDAELTEAQTHCASTVLRKVAQDRLKMLETIKDKVMAEFPAMEHSLFVQGYRQTRGGRMVQFVRNDPQNPNYDRRKVWKFVDNGQEYCTDVNGKFGVDFAPYEHPADVMGVE